ncbi:hypothetical protein GTR02_04360 [Kineococcus sp. R8]|uniref:hypothetical protein n=1 Tax=Kineococcus siccus TaxID=2696567 RepID=UPI0014132243|nr:hypothetical protein [Kineococcus siccus]NAZ81046.1 hypothetical protein [Kineococcus siccus]
MSDSNQEGPILAVDLARRLAGDAEYQAALSKHEVDRAQAMAELSAAERPIVIDLDDVGIRVDSVWDLLNSTSRPPFYSDALPVLLHHLKKGGYPDRVLDGLARALTVKPQGTAYWIDLRDAYLKTAPESEAATGLANALGVLAAKRHYTELTRLVTDERRGSERLMMLKAVRRLGGESGRQVLGDLALHPLLGKEASHLLRRVRR